MNKCICKKKVDGKLNIMYFRGRHVCELDPEMMLFALLRCAEELNYWKNAAMKLEDKEIRDMELLAKLKMKVPDANL